MRYKDILTAGAGALVLGLLLAAGAQAGAGDRESSGSITTIEDLQDMGKLLFKLADSNNDNLISQKEATDAANLLAGGFFFRADANGDGTVSAEEARAAREALFNERPLLKFIVQKGEWAMNQESGANAVNQGKMSVINVLDSNHDGNLSATELRQAVQSTVQPLFMSADRNGDGQLDPSEVNQAISDMGRTAVQTAFNSADQDKNGAVSQAEFDKAIMTPAHVLFKLFDANNDGQVSADEMRSGMQLLMRELRSLQVPEPGNSLSHQIQQQNVAQPSVYPATTPRPVTPLQVTPGVAPTTVIPPQR
jgi:Ca2+-binding EF-hand superfamily protein